MHPSMFGDSQWSTMMFWYVALSALGGAFLYMTIVRSGYTYMNSALNPGVKVSFIEDTQRCIYAMGIVVFAPFFITLLTLINDAFVNLFANILSPFVVNTPIQSPDMSQVIEGMFEKIIASPFKAIIKLIEYVFGLKSIDTLIFNGRANIFSSQLFVSINTGKEFVDSLVNLSMAGFTVYFNALYSIRFWVVTGTFVATPIISWVWAATGNRQIIEIWAAELIQTIFMQTTHSFALGMFTSILYSKKGMSIGEMDVSWLSVGLISVGMFIASFGGSICVCVAIVMGIRFIFSRTEEDRANAKAGLRKAFIALMILAFSTSIAFFMAFLLSGDWGISWWR